MPVCQVTAVREVHAEDGITRFKGGHVYGLVRLGAGVRLNVHVFRVEQLLRALDRRRLCDVYELAAPVIALAGQPFGVLVGHYGAESLEYGFADEVLRRDQFKRPRLPVRFAVDGARDLRINFLKRTCAPRTPVRG